MWQYVLIVLVFLVAISIRLLSKLEIRKDDRIVENFEGRKVLLVIAHPDDEAMFFGPLLNELQEVGAQIYLLCLTHGNHAGQGHLRVKELEKSVQHWSIEDWEAIDD